MLEVNLLELLGRCGDGVTLLDAQWRVRYLNDAAARMLRRRAAEIVGAGIWSSVPELVTGISARHYQRAMQERVGVEFEVKLQPLGFWVEQRCLPADDGGLIVVLRDISQRKRIEEAQRRSDAHLRTLVNSTPDAILTLDRDGGILSINANGMSALELDDPAQILHTDWASLWQAEFQVRAREMLAVAESGVTSRFQGWCATARGNTRWWGVTVTPLPVRAIEPEAPEAFLCIARDLTSLKQAEEEQARTAERDHRIAETLQACLMPTRFDDVLPGYQVRGLALPLRPEEASVGGDFYDAFPLADGKGALVVGDVMGKGLEAALSIAEIRFALRGFLREDPRPAIALDRLNRFLIDSQKLEHRPRNILVSLSLAVLETADGTGEVVLAGAEAALIRRGATGEVGAIEGAANMLLGVTSDSPYAASGIRLDPGDLLVFVTDGVTEAHADGDHFGPDGVAGQIHAFLREVSHDHHHDAPDILAGCAHAIVGAAANKANGKLKDDACVLLTQRLAPQDDA